MTFERIEELLPFIEPEDFAGDETLSLICEALGVEIAAKLSVLLGGIPIYVRKSALTQFKRRIIRENRKRYSPRELALKLDVSESFVYQSLNRD